MGINQKIGATSTVAQLLARICFQFRRFFSGIFCGISALKCGGFIVLFFAYFDVFFDIKRI